MGHIDDWEYDCGGCGLAECDDCSAVYPDNDRYCPDCGDVLVLYKGDYSLCNHCGKHWGLAEHDGQLILVSLPVAPAC